MINLLTLKKYREKKGKTFLGNLDEAKLLEEKIKNNYLNYSKLKENQKRLYYREQQNLFYIRLYKGLPQQFKDFLSIFYKINNETDFIQKNFNPELIKIMKQEMKKLEDNIIRKMEMISKDNLKETFDKLKIYMKKYYKNDTLKSFFFKALIKEAYFFHKENSFKKEIRLLNILCNTQYSFLEIEEIKNLMYNCVRDDRYTILDKSSASKKSIEEVVDALIRKDIYFGIWGNTDSRINYILGNINIDYQKKKQLIYTYCNQCSSVIAGEQTLSKYNFDNIKKILKEEDFEFMINNILFIGNNSIKIERKKIDNC